MFKGRYWTRNHTLVLVMDNGRTGYSLQGELVRLVWNLNGNCTSVNDVIGPHGQYDLMNKVNPQSSDNEVERVGNGE